MSRPCAAPELGDSERDDLVEPLLSFVIPALNEGEHIHRAVSSVHRYASRWLCDLIVVDHGSSDATAEIAGAAGARVVTYDGPTIAGARNRGVLESGGRILVFIDADVSLTANWSNALPETILSLRAEPKQVTGSRCLPEAREDFLTKYWFSRLVGRESRYVNSGHLIVSREFFDTLGGFDTTRSTAEDHDLCMRATAAGARVHNRPELRVVHHDYPSTVRSFVAREAWHGLDDYKDWKSLSGSRLGILVCVNLAFLVTCAVLAALAGSAMPLLFYVCIVLLGLTVLTVQKFGYAEIAKLPGTLFVFSAYMIGRTLALALALRSRYTEKSGKG